MNRASGTNHMFSLAEQHPSDVRQAERQRIWARLDLLFPALLALPVCVSVALDPRHDDSSLFVYVGQSWAKGVLPYLQNFDNKPPGIFALIALVSHFGSSLWWIALAQFMFVVGTIVGVNRILERMGAPKRAVFFGTLCAALALNVPYYSPANMTESFMNFPMVFSMLFFLRALDSNKSRDLFFAGLCAGLACGFKPFGLSALLAQAAFLVLLAVFKRATRSAVGSICVIVLGAAVAWIPPVLYFWRHGALMEMLDASFLYNLYYGLSSTYSLSSLRTAIHIPRMLSKNLLPISTLFACLIVGSYQAYKTRPELDTKRREMWTLLLIWFLFGLLLVLAAGRGYEQYFLTLMPAIVVATGLFFWWSEEQLQGSGLQAAVVAIVLAPVLLAYFPVLSSSVELVFSQKRNVARDDLAAKELRRVSNAGNTLIVYGFEPWIFYSTQLGSISRYHSTHYVYDSARSYSQIGHEILNDMQRTPPDFIVIGPPAEADWFPPAGDPFKDEFMEIVKNSYVEFSEVPGYALYRRK
jgi:4-amino-4-deoxy-L-arabinose transferase-like glycosyltransferase